MLFSTFFYLQDQDTPKEEAESETFVPVTAEDFKNLGNECVRAKNFFEAILHYSEAIKINPLDYLLFSNRSLAFLKTKQYYHAFQDAEQTINLNPNFGKVGNPKKLSHISIIIDLFYLRGIFERLKFKGKLVSIL